VVEPEAAPALIESIRAGRMSRPMARLLHGAAGLQDAVDDRPAGLARDADLFVTITEDEAAQGVAILAGHGLPTTPSGAAGIGGLLAGLDLLGPDARVLAILSEGRRMAERSLIFPAQEYRDRIARLQAGMAGRAGRAASDDAGRCLLCHRLPDPLLGKPGAALVRGRAASRAIRWR
jgi:threonine dehydratase